MNKLQVVIILICFSGLSWGFDRYNKNDFLNIYSQGSSSSDQGENTKYKPTAKLIGKTILNTKLDQSIILFTEKQYRQAGSSRTLSSSEICCNRKHCPVIGDGQCPEVNRNSESLTPELKDLYLFTRSTTVLSFDPKIKNCESCYKEASKLTSNSKSKADTIYKNELYKVEASDLAAQIEGIAESYMSYKGLNGYLFEEDYGQQSIISHDQTCIDMNALRDDLKKECELSDEDFLIFKSGLDKKFNDLDNLFTSAISNIDNDLKKKCPDTGSSNTKLSPEDIVKAHYVELIADKDKFKEFTAATSELSTKISQYREEFSNICNNRTSSKKDILKELSTILPQYYQKYGLDPVNESNLKDKNRRLNELDVVLSQNPILSVAFRSKNSFCHILKNANKNTDADIYNYITFKDLDKNIDSIKDRVQSISKNLITNSCKQAAEQIKKNICNIKNESKASSKTNMYIALSNAKNNVEVVSDKHSREVLSLKNCQETKRFENDDYGFLVDKLTFSGNYSLEKNQQIRDIIHRNKMTEDKELDSFGFERLMLRPKNFNFRDMWSYATQNTKDQASINEERCKAIDIESLNYNCNAFSKTFNVPSCNSSQVAVNNKAEDAYKDMSGASSNVIDEYHRSSSSNFDSAMPPDRIYDGGVSNNFKGFRSDKTSGRLMASTAQDLSIGDIIVDGAANTLGASAMVDEERQPQIVNYSGSTYIDSKDDDDSIKSESSSLSGVPSGTSSSIDKQSAWIEELLAENKNLQKQLISQAENSNGKKKKILNEQIDSLSEYEKELQSLKDQINEKKKRVSSRKESNEVSDSYVDSNSSETIRPSSGNLFSSNEAFGQAKDEDQEINNNVSTSSNKISNNQSNRFETNSLRQRQSSSGIKGGSGLVFNVSSGVNLQSQVGSIINSDAFNFDNIDRIPISGNVKYVKIPGIREFVAIEDLDENLKIKILGNILSDDEIVEEGSSRVDKVARSIASVEAQEDVSDQEVPLKISQIQAKMLDILRDVKKD